MADEAKPRSPAAPRPGGKPAYIEPNCPKCGTELVLHDSLPRASLAMMATQVPGDDRQPPSPRADEVWHDEWECPTCLDGIYLDQP